ncbi:MAG: hypothetical protein E6R03_16050 [Hyphomicrobiaceae bacterium]|nr:MAG: hypothetical protein E6R03_16050 [Hyphomicrobiaceae bacterium]
MAAKSNPLHLFEAHGIVFSHFTDTQAVGACPWTGKDGKFYVNKTSGLWDSKTAGKSGNPQEFLRQMADLYAKHFVGKRAETLALDRGIPVEAFESFHVGWNGRYYTIPSYAPDGTVTDIRFYSLGGKMRSTPGARAGLVGVHTLRVDTTGVVYVCEGEWDAMAWAYTLTTLGRTGAVIGVPGSSTFKPDWAFALRGKRIFAMYDADDAGRDGLRIVAERCANTAASIAGLEWPDDTPQGWDVRDEVKRAIKADTLPALVKTLMGRFAPIVMAKGMKPKAKAPLPADPDRPGVSGNTDPEAPSLGKPSRWTTAPTLADVERTFRKWLYLDSMDALHVMLATVVSQTIDGAPIWVFLVAPPGGSKTEHLNSLSWVQQVYMTSSLTPHSLISGANYKNNEDPSLIPRLDGKVMVIKDFTAILGMRDADKEEIFSILRDAYDGHCGKVFGNGIERAYQSRFTILGAVTPAIYTLSGNHAALGERFLKFTLGDNIEHKAEDDIVRRAITNINRETSMRDELADAVNAYLTRTVRTATVPTLDDAMVTRIIALSKFGARMRGTVTRDTYRHEIMTSRPSAEVGSRLGVQMAKLGQSLAMVRGAPAVGMREYALLKKVMLDTIPQRLEDMVRCIVRASPHAEAWVRYDDVMAMTRYPLATVKRLIQDLHVLGVVHRRMDAGRATWALSPYMRGTIAAAGLYTTDQERNRRSSAPLRARRRPGTPPGRS